MAARADPRPILGLEDEGRALLEYLSAAPVSAYALDAYVRLHAGLPDLDESRWAAIDRVLVRWARRGGFACRLADAYARRLRAAGPLRLRLVLALAVLESSPGFAQAAPERRRSALLAAFAVAGLVLGAIGSLVLSLPLLGPVHLLSRGRP